MSATMGADSVAIRSRRHSRRAIALTAVVLTVFTLSLATFAHGRLNFQVYRIDLDVYRLGAHAWLAGHDLYGPLPRTRNGLDLGFTYPPISAVAMSPLAVIPQRLAGVVVTAASLGLLMAVVALFLRTAGLADRPRSWRSAAALLPAAVLIEPVRTTLAYGQINILLMALVAFDCLVPSTVYRVRGELVGWPRGALVGVAAALKLTPAVFVLYFLVRRQWRAAATAAASFAATTGLGFVLAPGDSARYWGGAVFQTGRIGPMAFAGNQSLNGVLNRAHLTGGAQQAAWLAAAAAVGLLALVSVRRAALAGRPLWALSLTACAELLVSPVSWSHHWVWAAPVTLTAVLAARRAGGTRASAWAYGGVALFVAAPQWWFPGTQERELRWAWWEQAVGSAYVWAALGALVYAAGPWSPFRQHPVPAVAVPELTHADV